MSTTHIEDMLRTIASECRFTSSLTGKKTLQPEVMAAMARVLRHEFVPESLQPIAYDNTPLPIGNGQTISQPFIVALMTDLLNPCKDDVILEVGTGSGYQAAILSLLVKRVYTIEIVSVLAEQAAMRLAKLGYENIDVLSGDGYRGWPEHAPFDGIIVTAAADHIPPPLKQQLRPGGKMVIPVGYPHQPQQLLVMEKKEQGEFTFRNILTVAFVPFTGEARLGWSRNVNQEETSP